MNILFICGSAEPGKDGVGDYTRRLAGELIRKGHQAYILSLCDKEVASFINTTQKEVGTEVVVNRIPKNSSDKERLKWTQGIIKENKPDCISLQYVPYSFHPKGLPFWLPTFLKKIKGGHQWHIMFHELWIGLETTANFKSRFIGFIQQKIVVKLLNTLLDVVINTHANIYKRKLDFLGFPATLLPLYSNIAKEQFFQDNLKKDSKKILQFALFGGIHPNAPIEEFIHALKTSIQNLSKDQLIKFVFIGNSGKEIEKWKTILENQNISYTVEGFCEDKKISKLLLESDYGVSTTPYLLAQKASSIAAMLQHELPVICVSKKWEVIGVKASEVVDLPNIVFFEDSNSIQRFLNLQFLKTHDNTLASIASKFINQLIKKI